MQVSSKLRKGTEGYYHWCPGCEEMHILPNGWIFNGNLEMPTFQPSFRHGNSRDGKEFVCHYILTDGNLHFCGDSMHKLAGQIVPLPTLPPHLQDNPPSSK